MRLLTILDTRTLVLHESSLPADELVKAVHAGDPCLHLPAAHYGWVAVVVGDLVIAMPAAEAGHCPAPVLTARQEAVLSALLDGLNAKQIAIEFKVTVGTARKYIHQVRERLGVTTHEELILRARGSGTIFPCDQG